MRPSKTLTTKKRLSTETDYAICGSGSRCKFCSLPGHIFYGSKVEKPIFLKFGRTLVAQLSVQISLLEQQQGQAVRYNLLFHSVT